jgi:hypothetical protein
MSAFLLACLFAPAAEVTEPEWETDLEVARKVAKEKKRPMFVVFRCDH